MATGGGLPQDLLRPALLDVVRRKETRKILTGDLLIGETRHPLRTGIPTANLAQRTQHEDGVVLDPLNERPIFALAFLQRPFRNLAPRIVALDDPTGGPGYHQAQDGSEDQNSFGTGRVPLRVRIAQHQQSALFVLHLVNELLIIDDDLQAGSGPTRAHFRQRLVISDQIDVFVRESKPLGGQPLEVRNPALLDRVVYGQIANGRRMLLET